MSPARSSATGIVPPADVMLDLLPGLVALFDHDLIYVYANRAYQRWRGLAPEEVVGRHCREVVGEANFPNIAAKLRAALSGEAVTYEYDLFDKDHYRRVQGSYVPHRDADGAVTGVLVLVTDISERHDLQRRIADSEQMFEQSFRNAPLGMVVIDSAGVIVRANPCFCAMLKRDVRAVEGENFATFTHPDDVAVDLEQFGRLIRGARNGYQLDKRYLRSDGQVVEAHLTLIVIRDPEGQPVRFVVHVEDVTEARAAERRIQRHAARLDLAMDVMRGGFWTLDVSTGLFQTSDQLGRFVTGEAAPLGIEAYTACILDEDLPAADLSALVSGQIDRSTSEYRIQTTDGVRWIRCDRRLARDADGNPEHLLGVAVDVTAERERQRLSEAEADTDALTGLLNRRGLERRLGEGRTDALGVVAIDLDRFKEVNDRFGHAAGDAVLAEVAERLRREVRAGDMVARLGGDEFLVVMPEASGAALRGAAERIARIVNRPFRWGGTALPVGGSVGASWTERAGGAFSDLLCRADEALYGAKQNGRGSFRIAA